MTISGIAPDDNPQQSRLDLTDDRFVGVLSLAYHGWLHGFIDRAFMDAMIDEAIGRYVVKPAAKASS